MKNIVLILSCLLIILFSCSKDKIDDNNITTKENTQTNQNDTIIPYSVTNCCDTNYVITGVLDPSITFISSVMTPNGDGYNDCFGIGYSSSPTQVLTFEMRDSLNTLVYIDSNFTSNSFCTAKTNFPINGSLKDLPEGMYDATLSSSTGNVKLKLCIIDNQCLPCYNSCKRMDFLDPQFF